MDAIFIVISTSCIKTKGMLSPKQVLKLRIWIGKMKVDSPAQLVASAKREHLPQNICSGK